MSNLGTQTVTSYRFLDLYSLYIYHLSYQGRQLHVAQPAGLNPKYNSQWNVANKSLINRETESDRVVCGKQ